MTKMHESAERLLNNILRLWDVSPGFRISAVSLAPEIARLKQLIKESKDDDFSRR
jgi:hypothetical protein